jgi:hypothetical protein
VIVGLRRLTFSSLISLVIKIASFATCDSASNSASVVEVVTVSCLLALYAISPLNSLIAYPCELLRSRVLSAKDASLATCRVSPPPS